MALYCSSSTPDGWNFSVTLTPLAFWASVNFGITYLAYQSASAAFLPPAIALDVTVSATSVAVAFWVGLAPLVPEDRSHAATSVPRRRIEIAGTARRASPRRVTVVIVDSLSSSPADRPVARPTPAQATIVGMF